MVDSAQSTSPKTGKQVSARWISELIMCSVLIVCVSAIIIAMIIREPRYKPIGRNGKLVLDTHTGETFAPKHTSKIRKEQCRELMQYRIIGEFTCQNANNKDVVYGNLYNGNPKTCVDFLVISVVTTDSNGGEHVREYEISDSHTGHLLPPLKTGRVSCEILLERGHSVRSCRIREAYGHDW